MKLEAGESSKEYEGDNIFKFSEPHQRSYNLQTGLKMHTYTDAHIRFLISELR